MSALSLAGGLPVAPATAVFGADGFIGRNILAGLLLSNPNCVGIARRPVQGRLCFDLSACHDVSSLGLKKLGISHAIIAAGVSNLSICEQNPAETYAVNVTGTVALARQLLRDGIRVVVFSSDYVFDGRDGRYNDRALVNPLNEYGQQKVATESSLLAEVGLDLLIIRLSKVFDTCPGSGTLLDEMAGKLLSCMPVRAAFDQYFCPTLIDDVVAGVLQLLTSDQTGIVHLCAPTRISRLQLAKKLAIAFGSAPSLLEEISLHDIDDSFRRPLDTSMVCSDIVKMTPDFFTSLDVCIARLRLNYRVD